MKVLVVGSGGREHALAWAIARSGAVEALYVAPGNAGTAGIAHNLDIAATDVDALYGFAREHRIDLTVVGPEAPLNAGIVDRFRAGGLVCYGPTAAGARLEGSKAFAKEFMLRHGIPTAAFAVFDDPAAAKSFARSLAAPLVIKADGLAAGKGVIIAQDHEEADRAIDGMMVEKQFGASGGRVVVEEFLAGEEVSVHAMCDGARAVLLPSSQDHKRAFDGDAGPNTGGMGAIAPVPWMTPEHLALVRRTVIEPVLEGMIAAGTPFTGTLYAGLMWTADGPKVLEFNTRFGDPETEVLMPLLAGDVAALFLAAASGRLPDEVPTRPGAAATVVVASRGYPENYRKGLPIGGLDAIGGDDCAVFHAGTRRAPDGTVVTAGGRVLAVTGWAGDLRGALRVAYDGVARVQFDGAFWRSDIGRRHVAADKT
ncbi:MAG: phosphoribosylamine--glycine ligase [Candidatus Krumholzibacteria bacterium]|nr:phosphoribosylamine--glycine ligase [Candidatus Krumholzibacteria bacterium]MDH4336331.1 phosphoribosylamine--glycine ligase [Candidatus Krumholzibacteria bacterium]MDH5270519.1 phosphoribosylamine--glycine ligase [Candidatus Krumholzibacteria bacterium]